VTLLRRLDHVGLVVRDTQSALDYFTGTLGMTVVETEDLEVPPVRLTFLEGGGAALQLVEPLVDGSPVGRFLAEHGEGLHHVCFEVDDLLQAVRALSGGDEPELVIEGQRRRSAFVPNRHEHGLLVELTQQREEAG
jgi:methylmalonyl-CoA epimerase